ncbi:uncharacterized protein J4E92_005593 [Alternaria infectoria]|uniref:uncharacterized protein n=1 Tax=Alternaria infectoria TaxID=45303 RepID=UPI00221F8BDC|nr:uncharacterized protein J4E92_005593 [Alternaria infectoria]KAI4928111.1 hypothetical protein J4E92_005593 [Alternaria infectoria]
MANDAFNFYGDESDDAKPVQNNLDDLNDAVGSASGEDDDYIEDAAQAADDSDDGDFKLDGYEDLGIPEEEVEDEVDDYDPEYDDNMTGQKRKRVRTNNASKTKGLQRSVIGVPTGDAEAFILDEDNSFLYSKPSRKPGTFGRVDRRKGESLPAYHKRVTHELDSDDELMMTMREKGFSDRQIADKLAKDGRVRYDQKSISTRIMRIRLAQCENVDFLLKEGYKEWEYADDELLVQSYALADIEVNYELERIRAWRFRKVSDYMRRLNKNALFSAKACRNRYNELVEGTARIPTDMDDDPDARRMEMEEFRMMREKTRIKEQADKDALEAAEAKIKNDARVLNAQKAEEIAEKRQAKEQAKAHRAMTRAAQAQIRLARANANRISKTQRNTQIKTKGKAQETKKSEDASPAPTKTKTKKVDPNYTDPRSYLSFLDLKKICENRGIDLPRRVDKDTLLQAIVDADDEYNQNELKKMCRSKGLNANTSKLVMKQSLALASAKACDSYDAGVAAANGTTIATVENDGDDEMDMEEE